jgi:hypothetical protein
LLIKAGLRTLSKVNTVDFVRFLIVLGYHGRTGESLLNSIITILVAPLCVLSDFIHVLNYSVRADHFKAHINIEQTTLLFHYQPRVKARPNLNVMSIQAVSV